MIILYLDNSIFKLLFNFFISVLYLFNSFSIFESFILVLKKYESLSKYLFAILFCE